MVEKWTLTEIIVLGKSFVYKIVNLNSSLQIPMLRLFQLHTIIFCSCAIIDILEPAKNKRLKRSTGVVTHMYNSLGAVYPSAEIV